MELSSTKPEPAKPESGSLISRFKKRAKEVSKIYTKEELSAPDPVAPKIKSDTMVMWISSCEARTLWVRPNKTSYPTPSWDEKLLNNSKLNLPLFNGFLHSGEKVNGKSVATEAIITLDVDDKSSAIELEAKFDASNDSRFFKSYSASGRCKVHCVVKCRGDGETWLDFNAGKAARAVAIIIGFNPNKLDYNGVSRLFVTQSFFDEITVGDKTVLDYNQLISEGRTIAGLDAVEPTKVQAVLKPATDSIKDSAKVAVEQSGISARASATCTEVLALLMTMNADDKGQRFLSQHAAAATLGISQKAVSRALIKLEQAGIIEFTEKATFTKCRRIAFKNNYHTLSIPQPALAADGYTNTHRHILKDSRVEDRAKQLREDQVACPGNYNEAEKMIAGVAIAAEVDFIELLTILSRVWPGWDRKDRVKRVESTYKAFRRKGNRYGKKKITQD